jgi:hypothetical protein
MHLQFCAFSRKIMKNLIYGALAAVTIGLCPTAKAFDVAANDPTAIAIKKPPTVPGGPPNQPAEVRPAAVRRPAKVRLAEGSRR